MKKYHLDVIGAAIVLNEYQDVVIDRWSISELVYGTVFRRYPSYDVERFMLENYYPMSMVLIYCTNDKVVDNHEENKKVRDEMFDSMRDVARYYDKVVEESNLPWVKYDYTKMDMNKFIKGLIK